MSVLVACLCVHPYTGGMKRTATPEDVITEHLALVAGALQDCFTRAQNITDDNEYGHKRSREFSSAVTLLKASAKLGLALARIKGEFNQNIRVHRGEGEAKTGGSNG